jgi:RNA polymerase sigma-70 factor (ECF subfamily)
LTEQGTHTTKAGIPGTNGNAEGLRQLIASCLRNDRTAQRRFYEAYAPAIYGVIRRYVDDNNMAQDIHSEAFYRIFKRLDQYRFEGALEGWMHRIAVHAVTDHFRKQRLITSSLAEDTQDIPMYHDSGGLGQLAYKELLAIIHQLPTTQRAVFNLFVFEQYGHKEIASLLEMSENNSRWHLNDARRRLKEKIKALYR